MSAPRAENSHSLTLKVDTPAIEWVLERLAFKCCPQGLNVMAEELRWLGLESMTQEKLILAINAELKRPRPRVQRISDAVYWFSDERPPAGWSLYGDLRMLPCFYRRYPPSISWEELDTEENRLPRPDNLGQDAPD
ncbi:MAG TPA: hypothetical protein VF786_03700 [Terriglobales bacterium]